RWTQRSTRLLANWRTGVIRKMRAGLALRPLAAVADLILVRLLQRQSGSDHSCFVISSPTRRICTCIGRSMFGVRCFATPVPLFRCPLVSSLVVLFESATTRVGFPVGLPDS